MTKQDILSSSITILKELGNYFCKTYHNAGGYCCNDCPMVTTPASKYERPCAITRALSGIYRENIRKGK